ncbi:MAG: hypothetical protein P1V20_22615 [Verrucomicrobiales bacterium]|nr:hypothetical protein [Verrucomicrobiales bacterium]
MELLSSRELAALIWIGLFGVWGATKRGVRESFWNLVVTAFATKLSIIWILGAFWMSLGVFILSKVALWAPENLKDTIVWCFSAGVLVLVHGFSSKTPDYKRIIRDLFKLTILLELLLSTFCFSVPVEFVLFAVLFFLTAIHAMSELKEEYRAVHNLANGALTITGFIMLWGALAGFRENPSEILSFATLKGVARPILLTLWLLPVSYILGIISGYETIFIAFHVGEKRNLRFNFLARLMLIRHFGFSLKRVLEAPRKLQGRHYGLYYVEDMRNLLSTLRDETSEFV